MSRTLRAARPADRDAVAEIAAATWPDRALEDYLPGVFDRWVDREDPDERLLVAVVEGTVVGVCQAAMCSADEGWLQGIRVHPDHRGAGHGSALTEALLEWCHDRGATVARNLVYGWNAAGLGQSRAAGFEPVTSCRWVHPEPASAAASAVVEDVDAAWRYWTGSEARSHLGGLAIDVGRPWALAELTRDRLSALAGDERVLAVLDGGVRGMAARTRTVERDDGGIRVAEYGVAAWADRQAAETLLAGIADDAADLGVDRARVCVPDTAGYLSDAAAAGAGVGDHDLLVHAADLTGR